MPGLGNWFKNLFASNDEIDRRSLTFHQPSEEDLSDLSSYSHRGNNCPYVFQKVTRDLVLPATLNLADQLFTYYDPEDEGMKNEFFQFSRRIELKDDDQYSVTGKYTPKQAIALSLYLAYLASNLNRPLLPDALVILMKRFDGEIFDGYLLF